MLKTILWSMYIFCFQVKLCKSCTGHEFLLLDNTQMHFCLRETETYLTLKARSLLPFVQTRAFAFLSSPASTAFYFVNAIDGNAFLF